MHGCLHGIEELLWIAALVLLRPTSVAGDDPARYIADEFVLELGDDEAHIDEAFGQLSLSWSGHTELLAKFYIEGHGHLLHVRHKELNSRSRRSTADLASIASSIQQVKRVLPQTALVREKRSLSSQGNQSSSMAANGEHSDADPVAAVPKRGQRSVGASSSRVVSSRPADSDRPRAVVHDKQSELPELRYYENKDVFLRIQPDDGKMSHASGISADDAEPFPFNDPFLKDQWYLINRGQAGGPRGHDLNVLPVWKKGISGRGVVVSILDDGVQHSHTDLQRNYDPKASADLNDSTDDDPSPDESNLVENSHGTRCAGEVAAEADNGICGVGVAFNARIGGVRMLDGVVTDATEARALLYNNQYISVYSASWGPKDDGETMEGPGIYCKAALREGVTKGRNGLGSIFVWATGNGGYKGDDCNADGYVSSPYTLSVGSINNHGQSTYFMESCPSTMAVVFTGGAHDRASAFQTDDEEHPVLKVVTTDVGNRCTLNFQGTSSAAPLAAGCIALILEANPQLSWRDVQHIVVKTAKIPNPDEPGWTINGAGYHVNDLFGFGVMDCGKMVELAQRWTSVTEQHICEDGGSRSIMEPIYRGRTTRLFHATDACQKVANRVDELEHVEMSVQIAHPSRGALMLLLTSPAGTTSEMLSFRTNDHSTDGIDFTFMTVHSWGEDPRGAWTLDVVDNSSSPKATAGYVARWSLRFYGTSRLKTGASIRGSQDSKAFEPGSKKLQVIMSAEQESSETVNIRMGNGGAALVATGDDTVVHNDDKHTAVIDSDLRAQLKTLLSNASPSFVNHLLEELRSSLDRRLLSDAHPESVVASRPSDDFARAGTLMKRRLQYGYG